MAKLVDMELKKAFGELQHKMVETSERVHIIDSKIEVFERLTHRIEMTERTMSTLPPETKTYESVGRMFLLTDLEEVKKSLANRKSLVAARSKELEKNKQYLEKNLEEFEGTIREMVKQRKCQNEAQ
ncbi:prefoldin subunit 1 [Plutella xylostella]|nr:prefoldin subunit 1 [Plutella xylostella]